MRKKTLPATTGNLLNLFALKLKEFKGESHRSYQKAFSSFQVFLITNYSSHEIFNQSMAENWVINNLIQGLTPKTVTFYLEKISGLYSGTAHKLEGGKLDIFKSVKKNLKDNLPKNPYNAIQLKLRQKFNGLNSLQADNKPISNYYKEICHNQKIPDKDSLAALWGHLALGAGVLPSTVRGMLGRVPRNLEILNICQPEVITEELNSKTWKSIGSFIKGDEPQWFAMRLRPKVKYETLLNRFSLISDIIKIPELFYPCEDIARRVGRKMVWKGKPVIRDVVFFKSMRNEIYPLFTKIYDLAWCYRSPGSGVDKYASIPTKAMDDFKESLGILSPNFEVTPVGEMKLKAGDEVIIVTGDYAHERAKIIKDAEDNEDGNKIFRVTLLNSNGYWDIGIDARLLKKA